MIDENNLGVFMRPYIDRKMMVASPDEECYQIIKRNVLKIIIRHYREAKKVTEVYKQFESVVRGSL